MRTFIVVSNAPIQLRRLRSDEPKRSRARALRRFTGFYSLVIAGLPRTHFRDVEMS